MKHTVNTTTVEKFIWDKAELRKLLATVAGVPEEEMTLDIVEDYERTGGLGGDWSTPGYVSLTRTKVNHG